jgi:hypothetical protein
MITTLITLLILALILYLIWYVVGMFVKGQPHQIIGIILALIFLLYALNTIGLLPTIHR